MRCSRSIRSCSGSRARESRDPYLTAIGGSVFYFFAARMALLQGGLSSIVGIVPVFEGGVLALLLRALLRIEPKGGRDLGAAGHRRRIGAGVRDRRDSAAAQTAVDHDRLGARRRGAGLALSTHPASRAVVLRRWRCCRSSSSGSR